MRILMLLPPFSQSEWTDASLSPLRRSSDKPNARQELRRRSQRTAPPKVSPLCDCTVRRPRCEARLRERASRRHHGDEDPTRFPPPGGAPQVYFLRGKPECPLGEFSRFPCLTAPEYVISIDARRSHPILRSCISFPAPMGHSSEFRYFRRCFFKQLSPFQCSVLSERRGNRLVHHIFSIEVGGQLASICHG